MLPSLTLQSAPVFAKYLGLINLNGDFPPAASKIQAEILKMQRDS